MEIDLHNIRHQDVQTKLDKFLGEHMMKGSNEVRIVTGNSDKEYEWSEWGECESLTEAKGDLIEHISNSR